MFDAVHDSVSTCEVEGIPWCYPGEVWQSDKTEVGSMMTTFMNTKHDDVGGVSIIIFCFIKFKEKV